ncbi:galactitol-1-phosphate 5-dehydrogenase [Homoserinibacter sp. YIM 151385]|uniref:galactitol-1-phosphate 5-dehydrogenase n=1 Tax=Homoserinibacter sp. YIM 151385 TaxID=2985506 RepID=UPI0022F023C1|nr:galactitol-1-phosphate 5-dehydrogenase [Homoserinibacter sp. YIM 151385]WBU39263.1 galactitol-1-phosphate 5-dehydrogenase [Homoserinibacter sp. YIM 151385]
MTEKMTAVQMHGPGDLRVEQVEIPTPGPGEMLVAVAACGVCGSDIPRMNVNGAYRHPIICGHEFSGHVTQVADDVTAFQVGDLVSVPPLLPCRRCESCLEGHFSLCEDYDYFGSRRDGAYAQFVIVPEDNALKMPEGLDPRAAAMIDPSAIALHALLRTGVGPGSRVAVIGAGPIGLFAVQWARIKGATEILAVDLNEQKAAMAVEAGATHTANGDEEARAHAGKGYDVVIESAGVPPTIALAVSLVARRGHAAFIGIPNSTVQLEKAVFSHFLRNEVTLHGSWNSFSAPFPGREWTESAERLASGELRWEFMITHELGLEALPETMKQLFDRSIFSSKVLFLPNEA